MKNAWVPVILTVSGGVLYHLSQKSVPKSLNPLLVLLTAYTAAFLLCLLVAVALPSKDSALTAVKEINWAVVGIGAGAALIEIGFLLMYRSGWEISVANILVNVMITLILIPAGLLVFREHLSKWNLLGIVFCLIGLFLISRR